MLGKIKYAIKNILRLELESKVDIIAVFDPELNYVMVNTSTCQLMKKEKHELEGKNMLELFPGLIASVSHRHLLSALSGRKILDALSEGNITKEGAKFITNYYPLFSGGKVFAVVTQTRKLYFP